MADTLKTPRGTAVFPALNRPDTKFDENGSYKADLRVDPKDPKVAKFLDKIAALYKDHMGRAHPKKAASDNKNAVFYTEVDKETGEETGFIVVKMRVKNKISKRTGELWDRRPAQFDARGKPIATPKKVGGGTEMIVSVEPYCWVNGATKGVSLQPLAIQIIKLVEWNSQRDAAAYGFGEEEGYVDDDEDNGGFRNETDEDADDGDYAPAGEDDDSDDADY